MPSLSLDESKFFVSVYNCRLCGSVISSDEGVWRHEQVCRIPCNLFPRNKLRQMNMVKFPCPLVILSRISISVPEAKTHTNSAQEVAVASSTRRNHRRYSSLRALDIMSRSLQGNSSEDEFADEDVTNKEKRQKPTKSEIATESATKPKRVRRYNNKGIWGNSFRKAVNIDGENKYLCPVNGCGARLKLAQQLKVHFIMHLENNPYACPVPNCQIKCGTHHHFNRHINWHMGKNILSCENCGQSCADSTRLRNHQRKCTGQPYHHHQHERDIKTLEQMVDILQSHYANLESKGLLTEDKGTPTKADDELGLLKLHRRINMDKIIERDPVFLQACLDNPEFEETIPKTKGTVKLGESKKLQCSKCNKSYQTESCYKEHYNQAHRHRPYTCSKCGKKYVTITSLENHMKYHELTGNDIYMKQLKNGNWKCMKCEFQSKCWQSQSMIRHWFLIHKVTIPIQFPRKEKTMPRKQDIRQDKSVMLEDYCDSDEDFGDEDSTVVKIESEPALELAMIFPNNVNPIQNEIKMEHSDPAHQDYLDQYQFQPSESAAVKVKRDYCKESLRHSIYHSMKC